MKRSHLDALTAFLVLATALDAQAQSPRKEAYQVRIDPPPSVIVPADVYGVERYLNIGSASAPDFSPSGRWIGFLSAITGEAQVWRVPVTGGWPEQITFGEDAVANFAWSPVDEDVLVYSRDVGGNERNQIFLANLATGERRRLTQGDEVLHGFAGWSRDGRRIAYTSNERDPRYTDLYVMDVASGTSRPVLQKDGTIAGRGFSPDGRAYVAIEARSTFDHDLLWIDLEGGASAKQLAPGPGPTRFEGLEWEPDGKAFYVRTNQGREFEALMRYTVENGTLKPVLEPQWDVEGHALSRDGRRLATVVNEDGYAPVSVRDLRVKSATQELPVRGLPKGVASSLVWSPDGSKLAFAFTGPSHPGDIWIWDAASGEARRVTHSSTAGIPASSFVASELMHYKTFDGRQISGFLYRPPGSANRPVPVIVNVHGGPESQSRATFSALTQYYLGRGFGVFYPNVRGSTGFGKTFEHLDDVEKRLDSIKDLTEAARWLAREGIAPEDKNAVSGGSYGGYATLASLAFDPETWACGASTVGISNLRTFIANTGPWRRALRAAEYGDPMRDSVAMDAASPHLHADKIRAPLFVLQGANDPRVPKSESDQIVAAVRARGGIAEYMVFEDEGHGLDKLENKVKAYSAMSAFFEKHLLAPAAAAP